MKIRRFPHADEDDYFWARMGPFFANSKVRSSVGGFMTSDQRFTWWCAFGPRDRIIGFCAARQDKRGSVYLTYAYVTPEHRGQGVYEALFHARLSDVLTWPGLTRLYAACNPLSETIFFKNGFTQYGARGQFALVQR